MTPHQEARTRTLKLWRWLAKHPFREKHEAPFFYSENYPREQCDCPLCTLFNNTADRCRGCPLADAGVGCIVWTPQGSLLCNYISRPSPYNRWQNANSRRSRAASVSAAQEIVALVAAWRPPS